MDKHPPMPDDVRYALNSLDYSDAPSPSSPVSTTLPRLSTESRRWKDTSTLVDQTFDESILRALCDLDCGVPLLLERIKQSMVSCREASVYFKKRALLEEEYGRNMFKLSKTTAEVYAMNDGKAGSFVTAWQRSMKIHEAVAENRLGFAQKLSEMSEELAALAKEVDRTRKATKDLATKYERGLVEAEVAMEKAKSRFDSIAEELERVVVAKEGESIKDLGVQQGGSKGNPPGKRAIGKAVAKGGLLLKGRNPASMQRQEDDVRQRMSLASDAFRKASLDAQAMRQEYFNFQLPRVLRALKECADEIDLGTQYHLNRYAFMYESVVLGDGSALVPSPNDEASGPGLRAVLESIDNRGDFKQFMQGYAVAHASHSQNATNGTRVPRRDGPREEGFLPPMGTNPSGSSPPSRTADPAKCTFGVDLADQMGRDSVDIPLIMTKCVECIERWGMKSQGIYRLSGTVSKVSKLKEKMDQDVQAVDLDDEEWTSDINVVASAIKLWLRELPEPLLTFALFQGFVDAAKIDNDRLRHIRLHERVNELPDANYATLKYFMGHLHRISQQSEENQMTMFNLSVVFGPTLLNPPPHLAMSAVSQVNGHSNGLAPGTQMSDIATWQNKAIETILAHYVDIFVDESEE